MIVEKSCPLCNGSGWNYYDNEPCNCMSIGLVSRRSDEVYNIVMKFMLENDITCEETIYQCDWVIEHAYEFISDLYNVVKVDLPEDEDE